MNKINFIFMFLMFFISISFVFAKEVIIFDDDVSWDGGYIPQLLFAE